VSLLQGRLSVPARALGIALTIASIAFVCIQIAGSSSSLATEFSNPTFVTVMVFGMLAYACSYGLGGIAWTLLVRGLGNNQEFKMREALVIFGRSQILKYMPSNLLHYVGRYAMARTAGASHSSLLLASGAEIALQIVAASAVVMVLALPLFLRLVVESIGQSVAALVLLGALFGLAVGATVWLRYKGLLTARLAYFCGSAILLYGCSFLLIGGILLALLSALGGTVDQPGLIVGVNTSAWLAGFLVPGAPAGIGIREVLLIGGLKLAGNTESIALVAAVGFRLITFGGDILVALVSFAISRTGLVEGT